MFREHHALPNQPRLFRPHLRGAAQSKAPRRVGARPGSHWEVERGHSWSSGAGRGAGASPGQMSFQQYGHLVGMVPVGNRMTFSFHVVCKETLLEITLGVI